MSQPAPATPEGTGATGTVRSHWITALALVSAALLVFVAITSFITSFISTDDDWPAQARIAAVVTALGAVGLLVGLWGVRTGRLEPWVANTLIVFGSVLTALFFWLLLVPTIVGLTVIYAGVINGGLKRELRPG